MIVLLLELWHVAVLCLCAGACAICVLELEVGIDCEDTSWGVTSFRALQATLLGGGIFALFLAVKGLWP